MASKSPDAKTPARKLAVKKPTVEPMAVEVMPAVAETPVVEQPVWPVADTTATAVTAATETVLAAAVIDAAPTLKKEVITMEAMINDAAAKGETFANDLNSRAQAAMEKGTQAFADLNEFSKGNVEALVESSKIAANGLQSLGQGYADYARRQFEGVTATMKNFAGVKTPTEFMKLHADFVRGQFDSMVAETSKNTEAMLKLAGDVAKPISNRVAVAAEKLKVAA